MDKFRKRLIHTALIDYRDESLGNTALNRADPGRRKRTALAEDNHPCIRCGELKGSSTRSYLYGTMPNFKEEKSDEHT